MTVENVRRFLKENNISYIEEKRGDSNDFHLLDYSKVYYIGCYYDNCEIVVREECNIEHYNCNKYLNMEFLSFYK